MAPRIRTIKPTMWHSEDLADVSMPAHLLFVGMISNADDEGRLKATAKILQSTVFPLRDEVTLGDCEAWLWELEAAGVVLVYGKSPTRRLALVKNFKSHQRIDRPQISALPAPGGHHPRIPNPKTPANAKPAFQRTSAVAPALLESQTVPIAGDSQISRDTSTTARRGNGMEWNGIEQQLGPDSTGKTTAEQLSEAAVIATTALKQPEQLPQWIENLTLHHSSHTLSGLTYIDAAIDFGNRIADGTFKRRGGEWTYFTGLLKRYQERERDDAKKAATASSKGMAGDGNAAALQSLREQLAGASVDS
ncbi:MAG: hypothetical protein H7123_04015 [Thermoleophilia bacterium]|nr:hypothetical protein [Thermoleophilia bacterium]